MFSDMSRTCLCLALAALFAGAPAVSAQSVSQVADISPGAAGSNPSLPVVMGNVGYFAATDPTHGTELWRTDGTPGGTFLVADIWPGVNSSSPAEIVVAEDRLFFVASDTTAGRELWTSDGTAAGTHLVKDVYPGPSSSLPASLTPVGSNVFLKACVTAYGCELWKSDGTTAGTTMMRDIRVGTYSSFPNYLVALGNLVLFAANDAVVGEELWKSDGTTAGTVLVKNIDPTPLVSESDGRGRSYPKNLTRLGNVVVFVADNGTQGYELWKTDGTTPGTVMVIDLYAGSTQGAWSSAGGWYPVGDYIFFIGKTAANPAYRTFVTDGTAAGTHDGGDQLGPSVERAYLDGWFYYPGGSVSLGTELWFTDLTMRSLFANLAPGSASSNPKNLRTIGSHVYFAANDQSTGEELWRTDGYASGPIRVGDINPGAGSSSPSAVVPLGPYLLFTANDGTTGVELWSVILNQAPVADAGPDQQIAEGGTALLDGSASSDPESEPLTYEWRDHNGWVLGTEATTSLSLPNGIYDITLTVSDGELTHTDTVRVRFGNTIPLAHAAGPYSSVRNADIPFDGSASTDPDGDALTYTWDFGDGQTGTGATPVHSYFMLGEYTVTLTVNDGTADSTPVTSTVTIVNQTPVAAINSDSGGIRNVVVWFSGTDSSDPDSDPLTYTWNFGDGATGTGSAVAHAYSSLGPVTVTLTVSDGTTSASTTKTITIQNLRPWANPGGPYSGLRNIPIVFNGSASTDGDGDPLTYSWDFGDGGTATGASPSYTYFGNTTYTVTLTVSDGTTTSYPATTTVTVANQAPIVSAGGPYSGVRNTPIQFSATATDAEDDPLWHIWQFGDNENGDGLTPTHAYATTGTFTARLIVGDGRGPDVIVETTVTIVNRSPSANAGGPYNGVPGTAIAFDGSASSDPDGDPLTYTWDFGDGSTGTGVNATHAYAAAGTFTVTLTVSDGTASSTPATSEVTIANRAPTANAGGPYNSVRNVAITFDGAASSDPDGDSLTYTWDFGDGTTGTGVSPTHTYIARNTYTVTLTVSDGTDSSTPATATVTIANQPPTANAGGPYTGARNVAIMFDGSASTDPEIDPLMYTWDFGDGSTGGGMTDAHAYTTTGTFTVTLTVSDGVFAPTPLTATATTTVTITNQAPTANAGGPYNGVRNSAIAFSGAASSDADGDPLTYLWNFGDGATGTGASPTHAYASAGTFTVTLTVSDGTTSSVPATATVTIANQAPAANAGGPYSGTRLTPIAFNGSGSSDPEGDALTYTWNFGDGATGNGVSPAHSYTAIGTFTVTLTVNDGSTSSAPVTTTVQITNIGPAVSLTSPASGSVFHAPASVALAASANDPDGGVAKVEFYAGAAKIGEALVAPYAMTWSGAAPGTYSLTAVVTDSSGATAASAPVAVIVNAPPTVALTAPSNNAQFAAPASIALTATAGDTDGSIAQVQFFQGTTSLGIDTTSPYSVTWSNAPVGVYVLTAVATDNRGAITTSSVITVRVTASLSPTADSYVRGSNANGNFGNATTLTVQQGSSGGNQRWSYLKFDLTSVPSVSNAKLRVYGSVSGTTSTVIQTAVYPVSDTTWTETGLTWNNKPPSGTTALSVVTIVNNSTADRWYELDVTAYLQAEKAAGRNVVTLALKNLANSTPHVQLVSAEATPVANRPHVLVVP